MKPIILVVDDTAMCRRALERMLSAKGYEIHCAQNGVEALNCLTSFIPDLILLDLSMPLMDGLEVLERLRSNRRWSLLPVIVVTGKTSPDSLTRAIEAGALTYC